MCCLVPVGAGAVTTLEPVNNGLIPDQTGVNATADTVVVQGNAYGTPSTLNVGTDGVSVGADLVVGTTGTAANTLYIADSVSPAFTITSTGAVNIGGTLKNENASRSITLGGVGAGDSTPEVLTSVTLGGIANNGTVNLNHITTLGMGTVNNNGTLNATATDAVTAGDIIAGAGATTEITGASITATGNVQSGNGGDMRLTANAGGVTVNGFLQNSGNTKIVATGAVQIDGALQNDSNSGTLDIKAASLKVDGVSTDAGVVSSFVNNGNLKLDILGSITLANGFNFAGMSVDANNYINIKAGNLYINSDAGLLRFLTNNQNSFKLDVINGFNASSAGIVNGENNGNAHMEITSTNGGIAVASVNNFATLDWTGKSIYVAGAVNGRAGVTNMLASGTVNVVGTTTNDATMTISGEDGVTLGSVVNNGDMDITSLTSTGGIITTTGDVTNAATLDISARQLKIAGVLNNKSGTTNVVASDFNNGPIEIGAINVAGGALNLNALNGAVTVGGALNVADGAVMNLGTATKNISATGPIDVAGALAIGGAATGNGLNVTSDQDTFELASNTTVNLGAVVATANDVVRAARVSGTAIDVAGDVTAANKGKVAFSASEKLAVNGDITSNNGATVEFDTPIVTANSISGNAKFVATQNGAMTATGGDIDVAGVWFDGTNPNVGLVIENAANAYVLNATAAGANVTVDGGVSVAADKTLSIKASNAANIFGSTVNAGTIGVTATTADFGGDISNTSIFNVTAQTIAAKDIANSGNMKLTATNGNVTAGLIDTTAGTLAIAATALNAAHLGVSGGTTDITASAVNVDEDITVAGNLAQNADAMLSLRGGAIDVTARSLNVDGDFDVASGRGTYIIEEAAKFTGALNIAGGANLYLNSDTFAADSITNNGNAVISGINGITLTSVTNNAGNLALQYGEKVLDLDTLAIRGGGVTFEGMGLNLASEFDLPGGLRQNYEGVLTGGDVNIVADDFTLTTSDVFASYITQESGAMIINSSNIDIAGKIDATDLTVAANPAENWLNVSVGGDISGNTKFIGLEHMTVGGNYTFDNNSAILAAILARDETAYNYWATVSLVEDETLGKITNGANAEPLISVNGTFIYDAALSVPGRGALPDGQVGIKLFDIVDPGTAIWLLHADGGLAEIGDKIRNLNVNFCNADGTICFNYLDALNANNNTDDTLGAYISVRDVNDDGKADSLYVVFDPRFGGPVEIFKLVPIIEKQPGYTSGELASGDAIDNAIADAVKDAGFTGRTPIEAIPVVFKGTNLEEMANELYNRMEEYNTHRDGYGLTQFARLFQPREGEQLAGSVIMNEHIIFRDLEDRMMDEFIWNRNRKLKKAWLDADFGMFNQKLSHAHRASGNRFSVAGGFDWQESQTLILGLSAHVSHMSADNHDNIDLTYQAGKPIAGRVSVDVADTNIGLGGYLTKTLNEKMRGYGNLFLDMHLLDVSRDQNYVKSIDGDGTAFSLISEWGLMHDWLNQYVVGNLYARVGYNFGFSVTEKADADDYMKLKSDGYMILTPGYTLTAQKRIYPSAWFQVRPYVSVGAEYDVLGAPDEIKYKFAVAHHFTSYDVDIDPLWANIGGGAEFLSVNGIQVGLDYRYQYNADMQIHKIKLSGSYRF